MRCQLQKDETRLRGERDGGKWWKEMEVVFGKGQEKREEREKRRQTQTRRGIQGGDWEGQVSRENSHKNSSCVSSRKSPSTVWLSHTQRKPKAVQLFFFILFPLCVCECVCNVCARRARPEFKSKSGLLQEGQHFLRFKGRIWADTSVPKVSYSLTWVK